MNANLSEVSTPELVQEEKKRKSLFIFFSTAMVLISALGVYTATHQGSFLVSCLPLFSFILYIRFWNNLKKIREEIKARNASN